MRHRAGRLWLGSLVTLLALVGCGAAAGTNGSATATVASSAAAVETTTSSEPPDSSATAPSSTSASAASSPEGVELVTPSTADQPPESISSVPPSTPAVPESEVATSNVSTSNFTASIAEIDPALADRMASSWRSGCPVALEDLRYVTVLAHGFDGVDYRGEIVVAASVVDDVVSVFRTLYDDGYPIESMRLVDDFGGDDDASMDANNTSAFNCRAVTGGGGWSEHSYGTAIDLNPLRNPYVSGGLVLPAAGADYVDRPDAAGVIHADDSTVQAFAAIGWHWGGYWSRPIDYQHFSLSGR